MKVAIISGAELASQPGAPLDPEYWATRRPGETYRAWRVRVQTMEQLELAERYLDRAKAALDRARALVTEVT